MKQPGINGTILLLLLAISTSVAFAGPNDRNALDIDSVSSPKLPTILTGTLREGLDTAIAPCSDFEQYANGGWRKKQTAKIDILEDAKLRIDGELTKVLSVARHNASTTNDPIIQLLGAFYASCLRAEKIGYVGNATPSGKQPDTRNDHCITATSRYLEPAMSYAYVKHLMTPKRSEMAQSFLSQIRTAVVTQVKGMTWMDDSTQRRILRVLDAVHIRIQTRPDSISYRTLTLDSTQYNQNISTITRWTLENGRAGAQSVTPYRVIASANLQMITITPVFFQLPFYHENVELAASYASLGFVFAHELSHLLDPKQWRKGSDGYIKTEKLVATYSEFTSSGRHTVPDDVADLIGMRAVYSVWNKVARPTAAARIEGFTPEQRFFLYYAGNWRNTDQISGTQSHSGAHARVNGVLRHLPAFAKAFGCRENDPMVLPRTSLF